MTALVAGLLVPPARVADTAPAPLSACGWPCRRDDLGCVGPCSWAVRKAWTEERVGADAVALCAFEVSCDPDPRIGEGLLIALSSFPVEPVPDGGAALLARLRESGQDGVGEAVAARMALERGAYTEALGHLRTAVAGQAPGCSVARLAMLLAPAMYDAGQLGGALEAVQLGLDALAPHGGDAADVRSALQLTQIMIIEGIGSVDEAFRQTEELLAHRPPPSPRQRAWIHRTRIWLLYTRYGGGHQAEREVWLSVGWAWAAALTEGATTAATEVISSAFISLATMRREQGRYEEAEVALDLAGAATPDDPTAEKLYFRALIHRDRGDLARAEANLKAALVGGTGGGDGKPPVGDLVAAIPIELAGIRRAQGDVAGAEAALRDALGRIEELRASIPASDGSMIARHRQAYEELLGILVEQGRWADALEVLARLDAGRFVSDIGAPRERSPGLDALSGRRTVGAWQPPGAVRPRAPASAGELLAAWRGRHLVAVFRAGSELCRLEAEAGALRGACMGPSEPLEQAALALREDPADVAAARRVGDAVLPPGTDPLDLLLVGPIARAPIAALRDAGGLVVARRPLERVLGLLDDGAARVDDGAPRVVGFAGLDGEAAGAEREASEVARQLGVAAAIGEQATRSAVIGGAATVLHVAGHAHLTDGVPALELRDGPLSAEEIAAQEHAPRLVVLASCESASADDEGGWGSLAAAFLHAGSERVIASDRAVDDDEAQALMKAFYDAGGVRDPARALGVSQAARAAALSADALPPESTTWAAFSVIASPPRPPIR